MKKLLSRLLLSMLAITSCLFAIELYLRMFDPRYEYAAEAQYNHDAVRIWARKPNDRYSRRHVDTGAKYPIIHNNLSLRQHRDFEPHDMVGAMNVGVFGDSFVENLRVESHYAFTEPLDYALNEQGERANVLNFGVDGYGTGQSFLYYKYLPFAKELDYVIYAFCFNDLRNIYENDIFRMKDDVLKQSWKLETPPWVKYVSGFHTTYLAVDWWNRVVGGDFLKIEKQARKKRLRQKGRRDRRLHSRESMQIESNFVKGEHHPRLEHTIKVFQAILTEWQDEVDRNGGRFIVMLLPRTLEHNGRDIIPASIETLNLYEAFSEAVADYDYLDWRFDKDDHWNEDGNRLAAICIYRYMMAAQRRPVPSVDEVRDVLAPYYAAFESEQLNTIRRRYKALEITDDLAAVSGAE